MRKKTSGGSARDARYMTEARRKLNVSQAVLGYALGMTQSAISQIENGTNPLSPLQHKRIEQMIAARAAEQRVLRGGAYVEPCGEAVVMSAERFLEHLPECAACLALAATRREYGHRGPE